MSDVDCWSGKYESWLQGVVVGDTEDIPLEVKVSGDCTPGGYDKVTFLHTIIKDTHKAVLHLYYQKNGKTKKHIEVDLLEVTGRPRSSFNGKPVFYKKDISYRRVLLL